MWWSNFPATKVAQKKSSKQRKARAANSKPSRLRASRVEILEPRCLLALTPAQVVTAYGINQIHFGAIQGDGAGQTIAIIDPGDDAALVNTGSANFNNSDLHQFDVKEGLSDPPSFQVVGEAGGARPAYIGIATCTVSGNTVTVTTTSAHGLSNGDSVTIAETGNTKIDGGYTNITVVSPTKFTYIDNNSSLTNTTGGTINNLVDTGETTLDVEWAHAIAPGASIVLVETASLGDADIVQAITNAVPAVGASVVSMSFIGGEFAGENGASASSYDDGLFTQAGVSYVTGSGDNGGAVDGDNLDTGNGNTPQVGYPSASPNVLSVGATDLFVNGDNSYQSETAWNDPVIATATEIGNTVTITISSSTPSSSLLSPQAGQTVWVSGVNNANYDGKFTVTASGPGANQFRYALPAFTNLPASSGGTVVSTANAGGTGGGISEYETTQPGYQQGTVTKVKQSTTNRTTPDVSFVGGTPTPVITYDSDGVGNGNPTEYFTAGTSLSAPCWAGLIAIADQGRALVSAAGVFDPPLDTGATQSLQRALYDAPLTDFNDITSGNNGFPAVTGYDLLTGIGTPVANRLIPALIGTQLNASMENLYVRVDPNNSAELQVWADGGNFVESFPNNSAAPLVLSGDSNNNQLVIDESYGIVNSPITFDGGGSASAPGDRMLVVGSSGNDTLTLTPTSPTTANMSIDGSALYSFTNIQGFSYFGAAGNDNLTVDTTTSLLTVPIFYDGDNGYNFVAGGFGDPPSQGNGFNSLTLTQTGGTQTSDTYSVGPNVGQGSEVIVGTAGTQTIDFQNLAPVFDNVPATTLTVNATNAANAINYTEGSSNFANYSASPRVFAATWGEVSVDNQEPMEFTAKDHLVINGLAGDDQTNLNNPNVPTGDTGAALLDITANGDDPTASDTLIVNGRVNVADTITYTPATTTSDTGDVAIVGLPTVSFSGTEHLIINGQNGGPGGIADTLTIDTTKLNIAQTEVLTPGSTFDSGHVDFRDRAGGTAATGVPVDFSALGTGGSITFSDSGRFDNLIYRGTDQNDTFTVNATGQVTLNTQIVVNTSPSIRTLTLAGLAGDDTFNIPGNHNLTGLAGSPGIVVEGDDPSASDTLNFTGDGFAPVTLDLTSQTVTETGFGGVNFTGVEVVNLNANVVALTVNGTAGNDVFTYSPTNTNSGQLQLAGLNTVFNLSNISATLGDFTINGGTAGVGLDGTADEVIVQGTSARDLFEIDQGARTVSVFAHNTQALLPVTLGVDIQTLTAEGLQGQNTFQVIPAAGIDAFTGDFEHIDNLVINIDGGSPNSTNALAIGSSFSSFGAMGTLSATQFVVVAPSLTANMGTVRVYNSAVQFPDINYQYITTVAPIVFQQGPGTLNPNLLVLGADSYEPNDNQGTAAFLGSASTLQIQKAAIFPNVAENPGVPADQDYYRVVAQTTGTLDFQVYFKLYAGLLPSGGQLDAQVLDAAGDVIGDAAVPGIQAGDFGALGAAGDARVRIPAVAGQSYYLRIFGFHLGGGEVGPGPDSFVINGYNATIINTAPPVPYNLALSRSVLTATVLTGGSGYTSQPSITISGGGGTGATATALISGGVIQSITISGGTGYTSVPTIVIDPPIGPGVQATASMAITDTGDEPPLAPNDDSGRSQFDNVTFVNLPTIYLRLQDGTLLNDLPGNGTTNTPPAGVIPIPYQAFAILSATNSSPIQITTSTAHNLVTGDTVDISGVLGNTAANGTFTITFVDATHFTLDGSAGNGAYISGGVVVPHNKPGYRVAIFDGNNTQTPLGFATEVNPVTIPGLYQYTFTTALLDGVHNIVSELQMIDPATPTESGFGAQSLSLALTVDTVPPPVAFGTPGVQGSGLASPSDSGVTSFPTTLNDGVTNVTTPTFYGVAEANAIIRLYAQVNTTAVAITGATELGGVVTITTASANTFAVGNSVVIAGVGVAGYNGTFTITSVNPATFSFTYTDSNTGLAASSGGTATSVPAVAPAIPTYVLLGTTVAIPFDGTNVYPNGAWTLTSTVNLNNPLYFAHDGLRTLVLTAEDLAGNLSNTPSTATLNETLQIVVDTQGPQVSDVHISGVPTSTYNLFGVKTAPTFTIVGASNTSPIVITTNAANGFFTGDTVNIQGVVGNVAANGTFTVTVLDSTHFQLNGTSGVGSYITGGKAADQALLPTAPTPLVYSLDIDFVDQPALVAGFIHDALFQPVAVTPGEYQLVGDANGIIPIQSITFYPTQEVAGKPARGFIHLVFFKPLPDDRYTLTVKDTVVDVAGNRLDGESNASEPNGRPTFPSGDGQPGGNFVAAFIVNSRPHVGTWAGGSVYLDLNGNNIYDPTNVAASNRDTAVTFGLTNDKVFAGNFSYNFLGNQASDGFDKLASYGYVSGSLNGQVVNSFRWLYTNDYGQIIASIAQPNVSGAAPNGQPISGNWGTGHGITVGLYTGTSWLLDEGGTGVADTAVKSLIPNGYPIAGNFNDDPTGHYSFATYNNGVFYFQLWNGSTYVVGPQYSLVGAGVQLGANARPVAANMDQDGIAAGNPYGVTDVGIYSPDGTGSGQSAGGQWYWFLSANTATAGSMNWLTKQTNFVAAPLGQDLYVNNFGNTFALPVVGLWDPPIQSKSLAAPSKVTLSLNGTSGVDSFSFGPGTSANSWVVALDGNSQTYSAGSISVTFNGLGGKDTAVITGAGSGQNAVLKPGSGVVTGQGYSLSVAAASISVNAGSGSGQASFYGEYMKKNVFTASPGSAIMSDTSNTLWTDYFERATGFRQVTATGTLGSNDQASITDGNIASLLTASGRTASLVSQKSATDYALSVFNFGGVSATLQNKATVKKIGTTMFLLTVH